MEYFVDGENIRVKKGNIVELVGTVNKNVTNRIDAETVEDIAYTFDIEKGDYVENTAIPRVTRTDPLYTLEEVKQRKLDELVTARDAAIYSIFQSSGLGTVKTYGYNKKAAENFAKQTALMAFDPTIDQVQWATIEDGFVWHTRPQFAQVIKDGDAHDRSLQFRGWQLEAQVKAIVENDTTTEAQAIAQVLAIAW